MKKVAVLLMGVNHCFTFYGSKKVFCPFCTRKNEVSKCILFGEPVPNFLRLEQCQESFTSHGTKSAEAVLLYKIE
jgi:hypothetical protein